MSQPTPTPQTQIQIRYQDFTARFSNHALVTVGAEEVYIDFTSGLVPDMPGQLLMPIHTRIAMTPSAVVRLTQLLAQTVQNFQVVQVQPPVGNEPPAPAVPINSPSDAPKA